MDPELRFDYGPPNFVIDPVIRKPIETKPEIPKEEDNFIRTGTFNLSGYSFKLGRYQSINNVPINEPILYQLNGRIFYDDKSGKKQKLEDSTMLDDIISGYKASIKKKEEIKPVNKLPETKSTNPQKVSSKSNNLNEVKYPNSTTVLQKNGEIIIYAGILALGYLVYKNSDK